MYTVAHRLHEAQQSHTVAMENYREVLVQLQRARAMQNDSVNTWRAKHLAELVPTLERDYVRVYVRLQVTQEKLVKIQQEKYREERHTLKNH